MNHYMASRINNLFNFRGLPNRISNRNAPYYTYAIDTIKQCKIHKDFPNFTSKVIYEMILPDITPNVQIKYPNLDWGNVWKTVNFKYLNIHDRPVIYKFIHRILPTNKRLFIIKIRNNPLCDHCQIEDTILHKFHDCQKIQNCLNWVRKLIVYLCDIYVNDLETLISLDLPKVNKKVKNTLCIIMCSFISCTWYNRNSIDILESILKAKIIRDQKLNMKILQDQAKDIFTSNYCITNIEFICSL